MDSRIVVVAQIVESVIEDYEEIVAVIPVIRPRLLQHEPEAALLKARKPVHDDWPAHVEPVLSPKSLMEIVIRNSHNVLIRARLIVPHVRLLVVRYLLRIAALMPAALRLVLLRALSAVLLFLLARRVPLLLLLLLALSLLLLLFLLLRGLLLLLLLFLLLTRLLLLLTLLLALLLLPRTLFLLPLRLLLLLRMCRFFLLLLWMRRLLLRRMFFVLLLLLILFLRVRGGGYARQRQNGYRGKCCRYELHDCLLCASACLCVGIFVSPRIAL